MREVILQAIHEMFYVFKKSRNITFFRLLKARALGRSFFDIFLVN